MTTGKHSVEELASRIRKRPYSFISDNCLIKSVGFARRCTKMGVEAKVVPCLALSHKRVPLAHFRVPVVHPHFYAEVLGKRYEVSREPEAETRFGIVYNNEPKVLVRLVEFKFSIKE
jgi:hypothetical protein